ncbi:hypothetical protein K402DRAFT_397619 [Aulographum hederae CBS 113979]|uniref:Uncharacterized protein n=1 Tax=Aulographum hederae CBS 113979 TaxID=1176131 RepID=A0A6G1GN13_9PEZI|nr:hypothetical protein K402DRAFT_397619 [Aulographum hederae CBS 113979]
MRQILSPLARSDLFSVLNQLSSLAAEISPQAGQRPVTSPFKPQGRHDPPISRSSSLSVSPYTSTFKYSARSLIGAARGRSGILLPVFSPFPAYCSTRATATPIYFLGRET